MKKFLIVLLVIVASSTVAWVLAYPTTKLRYRLTVEVETPEGVKTGSAVREVTVNRYPKWVTLGNNDRNLKIRGEAVVIDLEGRGVIFAILDGDHAKWMPYKAFPAPGTSHFYHPGRASYKRQYISYYKGLIGQPTQIELDNMPTMVTFADMSDPTSVQLVYETAVCKEREEAGTLRRFGCVKENNFEALFGDGVQLKNVRLEITDDAVTTGVEKWLPWLPEYKNQLFDGRNIHTIEAENRLANSLGAGSFAAYTLKGEK